MLPSWQSVALYRKRTSLLPSELCYHRQNAPRFSITWAGFVQPFSYHYGNGGKGVGCYGEQLVYLGWPNPSYRYNCAGSNVLSVEAKINDTAKHACYGGMADQQVLF